MELFAEHGYGAVTITAITQRVGLTRRTFFRYFADKREVVFPRVDGLCLALERELDALPQGTDLARLSAAVFGVLAQVGELLMSDREGQRRRQALIAQSVELQERERTKLAASAAAIERSFAAREISSGALFGAVAMEVFRAAYQTALWNEVGGSFREHMDTVRSSTGAFLTQV
ncbi:TetR family transcriptional regulator [Deinococcus altitudinis]|uniref:TetR family transcriptional regulator n=1 Tax=Deinococcus altitudinis TaxID=468914 RepID=UPI0038928CE3